MIKQQICRGILWGARMLHIDGMIPDKLYLQMLYRRVLDKNLVLKSPKSFNEKLQWLKLYDRRPEYATMVDKYAVKDHVAAIIGEKYIIPTLGVWDKPKDIEWDKLPNQFVLKCTHDSGGLVICTDKEKLDKEAAVKKLNNSLHNNYYLAGREWPYKNVRPRIIAEKYINDGKQELIDYKFMCFNGKVKCSFLCTNRFSEGGLRVTFYDNEWKKMPFERHYPSESVLAEKPHCYDEMTYLAEKLSAGIPFVRVDFYEIEGHPFFGEMTFYPGNGTEEFTPEEWDYKLGEWIKLPQNVNQ